jgi:HD-like signal output (HDOD) protein
MNLRPEVLSRIERAPLLPLLAEKLLDAAFALGDVAAPLSAERRDAVEAAAEVDAGLCLDLLELINTPVFNDGSAFRTIRDALNRYDLARLACLAVCVAAAPRMRAPLGAYRMLQGELLEHALVASLAAEEIARVVRVLPPAHTFCAGFLGDIGKTCLDPLLAGLAERALELAAAELITFDQAEDHLLGVNHAEAGAAFCKHWELPPVIVDVVRWRLAPDSFPGRDLALDLVHMGESLAKLTGLGLGLDGMYYRPSTYVAERLGLTSDRVDRAMAAAVHKQASLSALFQRFGA